MNRALQTTLLSGKENIVSRQAKNQIKANPSSMAGKRWRASVFIGSVVVGTAAYIVANLLAPDFRSSNLGFGYIFLAPLLGFMVGTVVHSFARDDELYVSGGFGFGVGNLLASGALALPSAGLSVAGNLLVTSALAGIAFGIGLAFVPAAVALGRSIFGWDEP